MNLYQIKLNNNNYNKELKFLFLVKKMHLYIIIYF